MKNKFTGVLFLILATATVASAASIVPADDAEKAIPIQVQCLGKTWTQAGDQEDVMHIFLTKDVTVVRGELRVEADNMEVIRVGGGIQTIVATGNIRIFYNNVRAKCQRATYFVEAGKITMSETPKPVIAQGANIMSAPIIHIDMTQSPPGVETEGAVVFIVDDSGSNSTPKKPSKEGASTDPDTPIRGY